ncbi:MAG: class I SAM-dependent methyltransferase [Longimicrobiales bacterium]
MGENQAKAETEAEAEAVGAVLPAGASPFAYSGNELDALADARNYYRWLIGRFEPHLGPRVIEVGAGIGTFAEWILGTGRVEALTLIEPAANNYPRLARRFAADPRVRAVRGFLEEQVQEQEGEQGQDALVAVNVLEHVEDDVAFLDAAWRALRPGGALLIFVPAGPRIFGTLDRALEHHRRYDRKTLRRRLETAGFRIETLRYANSVGVLAWFLTGRVLRRTTLDAAIVKLYDRLVVPWLLAFENRVAPPLGQSLLAVARRGVVPI